MTFVIITYILGEPNIALGKFIPMNIAYLVGSLLSTSIFIIYLVYMIRNKYLKKEEIKNEY